MNQKQIFVVFFSLLSGLCSLEALRFSVTPPARISKSSGEIVDLKWQYSIAKPSELVRLECGYLNASRQMTKLMEQLSTERQPRLTNIGTRFFNRAYIKNGALVLTNLKVEDTGIYFCILKAYDATTFRTVTIRSLDTYLSIGGPASGGRSGSMSSGTRTTIIAIVVVIIVLVIAALGFFFFRKRDRSKRERVPTTVDSDADLKNGNYKSSTDKDSVNGTNGKKSQNKGLTLADIEVVHSATDGVNKSPNGMSYSTSQAYESVEFENENKSKEEWPEPPSPRKSQVPVLPIYKTLPPTRVPPRILPKPNVAYNSHQSSPRNEDMFV